jgi:hypothetical protein
LPGESRQLPVRVDTDIYQPLRHFTQAGETPRALGEADGVSFIEGALKGEAAQPAIVHKPGEAALNTVPSPDMTDVHFRMFAHHILGDEVVAVALRRVFFAAHDRGRLLVREFEQALDPLSEPGRFITSG